mmetsp:Transcript_2042/g.5652  ORF Transcript_2042/g.5652 Transcript_2042/m.5652 type:complete len:259 (+) Transcript_2042:1101-1877(+)
MDVLRNTQDCCFRDFSRQELYCESGVVYTTSANALARICNGGGVGSSKRLRRNPTEPIVGVLQAVEPGFESKPAAANMAASSGRPRAPSYYPFNLNALEDLRLKAKFEFQQVIESIPEDAKKAYLQAVEASPKVVETETEALQFVRFCNHDIQAAAKRLCLYWELRLQVFGPDRAFLPLVLSGKGALAPREVKSLLAGFPALLPETKRGQKVFLWDRRQHLPTAIMETHLKCMFYLFCLLAEDPRAQSEGVLGLVFLV